MSEVRGTVFGKTFYGIAYFLNTVYTSEIQMTDVRSFMVSALHAVSCFDEKHCVLVEGTEQPGRLGYIKETLDTCLIHQINQSTNQTDSIIIITFFFNMK